MRFIAKSHRFVATAGLAALVLALPAPAGAHAAKAGGGSMSDDEIYALTCGHLGVPCDTPHAHKARSSSRSKVRGHVRVHRAR